MKNRFIPSPTGEMPSMRAAAYVRMSTEHQQYSTSNQMDTIREYAARRNMEIVQIYSDEGKSGLNIQGRVSLAKMIADVQERKADYKCILVYDISRWGRFQDADESAHYEYICRRTGIAVHYCAEQFENDGTPSSTIIKTVKRAMAGEYSRELSSKVFQGACRLIRLGFKQGGTAGFGLRRMLVDHTGQHKGLLKMGEHKSIQTDRVILVPGPDDEVATACWIYTAFVEEGKSEGEIAQVLNGRDLQTDFGRAWTRGTVHEVLTNEKYIGNNVYHRTSCKLKQRHIENPPEKWVRANDAFIGIIDPTLFLAAQGIILTRSRKWSDEEMLEKLRGVLSQHGRISGILIDEADDLPSSAAFRNRFGSLVSAYRLIGYVPEIDYDFIEINRQIRRRYPEIVSEVVEKLRQIDSDVTVRQESDLLIINEELRVSIVLCRHHQTGAGRSRWTIRLDEGLRPDITIAVRLDETNTCIQDYYLLPALDMTWGKLRLAEENGVYLDVYRFDGLDYFYGMAERSRIEEAA
jgi:DNA invertase Pin-like site-specific DNA recombinase